MSKRRKKSKRHEEHVDESWLLPYSDLLTLLVALFIVLFASSSIDMQKFQSISNAFNAELKGGTGLFELSKSDSRRKSECTDKQDEQMLNRRKIKQQYNGFRVTSRKGWQKFKKILMPMFKKMALSDQLATSLTVDGLSLTFGIIFCLNSGSADVHPEINHRKEISRLA